MRFTVERDVALGLFRRASKVKTSTSSSTLVPNLSKAFVQVDDGSLTVTVTNLLQVFSVSTSSVSVSEQGKSVFPTPGELVVFLSALPDGEVQFDVTEHLLTVSAGATSMVRQVVATSEFPALPDLGVVEEWVSIPAGLMKQDFSAVLAPAKNSDEAQFGQVVVQGGTFIGSDGSSVHARAASGYECPNLALTVDAFVLIRSLVLVPDVEFVSVGFAKGATLFKTYDSILMTYDPAAKFPNIMATLSNAALNNDMLLVVDRDELLRAVMQVSGTSDKYGAVSVSADKGEVVRVRSKSLLGSTETVVSATFDQPKLEFTVTYYSLMQALKAFPQQEVKIFLGTTTAKSVPPVRLIAPGGEGGFFVSLISQLKKDVL